MSNYNYALALVEFCSGTPLEDISSILNIPSRRCGPTPVRTVGENWPTPWPAGYRKPAPRPRRSKRCTASGRTASETD